jgi:hypothetical protein
MESKQAGNEYLNFLKFFKASILDIQERFNKPTKYTEDLNTYLELTKQELQSQIDDFEKKLQAQNYSENLSDSLNAEDVVPLPLRLKNLASNLKAKLPFQG